jgi:hypothetical protein
MHLIRLLNSRYEYWHWPYQGSWALQIPCFAGTMGDLYDLRGCGLGFWVRKKVRKEDAVEEDSRTEVEGGYREGVESRSVDAEVGLDVDGEEEGMFLFFRYSVSSEKWQDGRSYLLHEFEECQLAKLESLPLAGLWKLNLSFSMASMFHSKLRIP